MGHGFFRPWEHGLGIIRLSGDICLNPHWIVGCWKDVSKPNVIKVDYVSDIDGDILPSKMAFELEKRKRVIYTVHVEQPIGAGKKS